MPDELGEQASIYVRVIRSVKTDQEAYEKLAEIVCDPMQKRIKQHLLQLFTSVGGDIDR